MDWHEELVDFGLGDNTDFDPNDPDSQLLAHIIENTCIPRLMGLVASSFDLFERSQNEMAFKLINHFLDYVSIKSTGMQNLLDTFEDRITYIVDLALEWIPALPPAFSGRESTPNEIRLKTEWMNTYLEVLVFV